MKYLPAIDLWGNGVQAALRAGALVLQSGQWVRCGDGPLSRFDYCDTRTGYVRAYHGRGDYMAAKRIEKSISDRRKAQVNA